VQPHALFALVLAINLLGDGVRDVTAPAGRFERLTPRRI
jgi:ABC-type dipeptide/oligopeptide/nickel transport system permease subunit